MINDLRPPHHERWKYIDDTTVSEIIHINTSSNIRDTVDYVQNWSVENKVQLNASKWKELVISFTKPEKEFPRLKIISGQIETVNHARLLGLTISKDLKCNQHITNIVKKANKRIYFIIQLKRAHVPEADIINFTQPASDQSYLRKLFRNLAKPKLLRRFSNCVLLTFIKCKNYRVYKKSRQF